MQNRWKLLSRKKVYVSKFVTVYEDEVRLPNDKIIPDYTVIEKPDIVMIVATDSKNNILILNEYKYAVNEYLLTLPAGHKKQNETAIETARRELLEETGYADGTFKELGTLYDYPSKDCHKVYVVSATNINMKRNISTEDTETLSLKTISIDVLKKQIQNKKWKSSSAIAALTLAGILR